MTIGIGGKTFEQALAGLAEMTSDVEAIADSEFESRLTALRTAMKANGAKATFLHASSSLHYFTGLPWHASERMVAAIVFADGGLIYIAPHFEADTLKDFWRLESELKLWQEHEVPAETLHQLLSDKGIISGTLQVDPATPFFMVEAIRKSNPNIELVSAQFMIESIRSHKSAREIAIIQRAHEMTLRVQAATGSILHAGITTTEVVDFIDKAHQAVGATGSSFCIVLFGIATSFPHGVRNPQTLKEDDWVLVDTGCLLHGYNSDITRTYSFGTPTDRQRVAWDVEKAAQIAAFDAAQPGQPCEAADAAARQSLESAGFGPDYDLPGLPHRAGHGCGLDIHEGPYLVRGQWTPLEPGMVFSSEPMLVLPGEFGVRLEDHFYITESGPRWFTQPSHSLDDPFGTDPHG